MAKDMKDPATEKRIIEAFKRMREAGKKIKDAELEYTSLQEELKALIPAGETRAGVRHIVRPHTSISYTKVVQDIKETLLPKTKLDALQKIIQSYTTETESHQIKADE